MRFLISMVLLVILYKITLVYVDSKLEEKNSEDIYSSCHKVWSARGLYDTREEQNSIKAISKAFELGAEGVEVDFHYDVDMDRFIVSHDHPKKDSNGKYIYPKKDGALLTLETLFKELGKDKYFWLDYKNLDKLTVEQTHKAIKRLSDISKFDDIKSRLYIEGSHPFRVSMYTDSGFKTILGIHPPFEDNIFSGFVINLYKMVYYFNNITAIAMPYGKNGKIFYGSSAKELLKGIPLFMFHVTDDTALVKELVHNEDIRMLLVGKDQSINRFDIDNCE